MSDPDEAHDPAGSATGVVLIVEDEADLADLYATWLADDHEVRTAYSGEEALELMDDAVDVVLLDRRLPGLSGDEVLEHIRSEGYECSVAMVSAVEPDFDIVAMGFDDYLVKPVGKTELCDLVDALLGLVASPETVRDYLSLVAKRDLLESEMDPVALAGNDQYEALTTAIQSYETHLVSVAHSYLETHPEGLRPKDRHLLHEELEELEDTRRTLDENDPLRPVVEDEIEKLEALLEESDGDVDVKRELLEVVADGFVAKGFWLDPNILHALNSIFFDKDHDTLVVERQSIEPGTPLTGEDLITASNTVRERAKAELASMTTP